MSRPRERRTRIVARVFNCTAAGVAAGAALMVAACGHSHTPRVSEAEARTARAFLAYEHQGPAALRGFMEQFPKGADLHVHLSGAVYAETYLREAAEDGLCVDRVGLKLAKPPCVGNLLPAKELTGDVTVAKQALYDRMVDSLSMRGFVATPGFDGHDQFFSTFDKFDGLKPSHRGEWVDEVASRAAAQNQQYLELMETPDFSHAAAIAKKTGWNGDFAKTRAAMLAAGLGNDVAADRAVPRDAEATRRAMEHCGTAQATAACGVEVRYIFQVLRQFAPELVFAQTLLGFETVHATLAAHEKGFVGINLVRPEDCYIAMRDYTLQMQMIDYLHSVYPDVPITLHAGELAEGMVPPEGLRFHIRQAVELGHAQRIGHGVDVMEEDNPAGLMKEMAEKHIMVEINLSSNEGILGVKGDEHPFPIYRLNHVPVALSTDDEGVSRIDITHEYVRAAIDYGLTYQDMKQLARTGLEHAFLPGASLWARPDLFIQAADACSYEPLGAEKPTAECRKFLDGSEKAAEQWELERRFKAFEEQHWRGVPDTPK